jgi:hypothetical protein
MNAAQIISETRQQIIAIEARYARGCRWVLVAGYAKVVSCHKDYLRGAAAEKRDKSGARLISLIELTNRLRYQIELAR